MRGPYVWPRPLLNQPICLSTGAVGRLSPGRGGSWREHSRLPSCDALSESGSIVSSQEAESKRQIHFKPSFPGRREGCTPSTMSHSLPSVRLFNMCIIRRCYQATFPGTSQAIMALLRLTHITAKCFSFISPKIHNGKSSAIPKLFLPAEDTLGKRPFALG